MEKLSFKKGEKLEDVRIEQCLELIGLVEQFPCLWNIKNAKYSDKCNEVRVFNEIEKMSKLTARDRGYNCCRLWKELVKKYSYEKSRLSKIPSGAGSNEATIKFKFYEEMRFLESNSAEKRGNLLISDDLFGFDSNQNSKDSDEEEGEESVVKSPDFHAKKRSSLSSTYSSLSSLKLETPKTKRRKTSMDDSEDDTEVQLLNIVKNCVKNLDENNGRTQKHDHSDIVDVVVDTLNDIGGINAIGLKYEIAKLCEKAKEKISGKLDTLNQGYENDRMDSYFNY